MVNLKTTLNCYLKGESISSIEPISLVNVKEIYDEIKEEYEEGDKENE